MLVLHKYCSILYEGLELLCALVSLGVLKLGPGSVYTSSLNDISIVWLSQLLTLFFSLKAIVGLTGISMLMGILTLNISYWHWLLGFLPVKTRKPFLFKLYSYASNLRLFQISKLPTFGSAWGIVLEMESRGTGDGDLTLHCSRPPFPAGEWVWRLWARLWHHEPMVGYLTPDPPLVEGLGSTGFGSMKWGGVSWG